MDVVKAPKMVRVPEHVVAAPAVEVVQVMEAQVETAITTPTQEGFIMTHRPVPNQLGLEEARAVDYFVATAKVDQLSNPSAYSPECYVNGRDPEDPDGAT